MRLLLTWSDRSPGRKRGSASPDLGPVLRLLACIDARYDEARVLTVRRTRAGARALADHMRAWVDRVDVEVLDVADPSDHAALFEELAPVVEGLPAEAEVDVLLSAGTPQAQTLWVILVQAGLLRARMLQVIPPQFVPVPHPEPVREVRLDIEGFPEIRALRAEVVRLRARVAAVTGQIVGHSPSMRRLGEQIGRVAAATVPVLVVGETGVGKELVARAIHDASDRADGPFVAENCGAFAEGVLASELFGHEAGAFTDAAGRRRGVFELASGGTLFLDEIGDLPARVQVQLLRVLQAGEIRRVGAEATTAVDVRVIAATHRDLPAMVSAGQFREDLFYRLHGATLQVPPLRERAGDLELLVVHFLEQADGSALRPTRTAWHALNQHTWPGNVRELQAEVRRWTVFCDDIVDVDDLSPAIRAARSPESGPSAAPDVDVGSGVIRSLSESVDRVERAVIADALAVTGGNLSATARALDIDRNTLKRKMARHGLARRDTEPR